MVLGYFLLSPTPLNRVTLVAKGAADSFLKRSKEGFVQKIRSNVSGLSTEQESIVSRIFGEFDSFIHTRVVTEPMRMLGELEVTDQRIQSLLREKDTEIMRLRDRIFAV